MIIGGEQPGHSGLCGEEGGLIGVGSGAAWSAGRAEGRLQTQQRRCPQYPAVAAVGRLTPDRVAQMSQFRFGFGAIDVGNPVSRTRQRARIEKRQQRGLAPSRQTRPRPILGTSDQARPQRVAFDVAEDGQQVMVLLDGECLEASLPDMAGGAMCFAVAMHMSSQQPLHPAADVVVAQGPQSKVKMIGHEAVAQEAHGNASAGPAQQGHEGGVVGKEKGKKRKGTA